MDTEAPVTYRPPWKTIIFHKGCLLDDTTLESSYDEWTHTHADAENELNALRERIHEYEVGDSGKWEYYKKIINPYELIYTQKKYDTFPQSVCMLHPLSRSYFKMVEILAVSDFFKTMEREVRIRTAHVCEGPGGFIEAVIDELTKRRKTAQQLTAMTLRPNQTNVPGWKRAAQFLQKNRNIKITYGADNTGDILKTENQNAFSTACGEKVQLFTSDGGFDFSTDYLQQERFIFPLLLSSVRIGFEVLKVGGFFVLKFFDTYYDGTKDLLYFLASHFQSWTLYKPATSRPCNPEQYFIGKGFRGCSTKVMNILKGLCSDIEKGSVQNRLFKDMKYPSEFDNVMNTICTEMIAVQTHYLKRVFDNILHSSEDDIRAILKEHEYQSLEWCRAFNAPVYPVRCHSIEVSRSGLPGAGRR